MTAGNPYVGPRPFSRGQTLFGRSRERRHLANLLVAERVVLMYSPSGAGKTSLIQAALIPDLDGDFVVRPVLRVNREQWVVDDTRTSRYLDSVRHGLLADVRFRDRAPIAGASPNDLTPYLLSDSDDETGRTEVLIFDQFEEILTLDSTDIDAKRAFFEEVGRILDHPTRRALFAMREEFVAALDPYLSSLPHRLDVRYRLDLLDETQAVEAIVGPARERGVTFESSAAELLVEQLRTINLQLPDGGVGTKAGPSVEPVQLQIVCERLWDMPRNDHATITDDDVEQVGGDAAGFVDDSLADYYASKVAEVAAGREVRERTLRHWITTHLVSSNGIRVPLLLEPGATAGMFAETLDDLEDARLIRRDGPAERRFIELSHDRLVGPILQDNERWQAEHLSAWQLAALAWDRNGLDNELIRGRELRRATWSSREDRTDVEERFLDASKKASLRTRVLAWATGVTVVLAIVAIALGVLAIAAERRASDEADRATSRQLAALSADPATPNAVGLVLAREAYEITPTVEARGALLTALERNPTVERFLHGHADRVVTVEFAPDGRWLASGGDDTTIRVLDLDTDERVVLEEHERSVVSLAFNADASLLASSDDAGMIHVWDTATWEPAIPAVETGAARIRALAFHPTDPATLASGGQDGAVMIWHIADVADEVRRIKAHGDGERASEVRSIDFDPSGEVLASGGDDHQVRLWEWTTGEPIGPPMGDHGELVRGVAFSDAPNARILASAGNDRTAIIWSWSPSTGLRRAARVDGQPIPQLVGHDERIYDLEFVPGTYLLATASRDRTVRLWDASQGTPWFAGQYIDDEGRSVRYELDDGIEADPLDAHTGAVRAVAFAPRDASGGVAMATASNDQTVAVWEPLRRARLGTWIIDRPGETWAADRHPTEPVIATAVDTSRLQFWDVVELESLGEPLSGHDGTIRAARFSPEGRLVATGGDDCTVRIWSYPDGAMLSELTGHERSVTAVAFSPEGDRVIGAGQDGRVLIWTLASGSSEELTRIVDRDTDLATCADTGVAEFDGTNLRRLPMWVDFSADAEWLLVGVNDGSYRIWNWAEEGEMVIRRADDIVAIPGRLEPAGVDYGAGPDEITLWDLPASWTPLDDPGEPRLRLATPLQSSITSGPDGTIVTASGDGSFRLWDVESGRPLGNPVSTGSPLASIIGFPERSRLVTVSVGGTIAVWVLDVDHWLRAVCPIAGRSLDATEWSVYVPDADYRETCQDA